MTLGSDHEDLAEACQRHILQEAQVFPLQTARSGLFPGPK